MERIKAVLFDLDNTILDRTRTFSGFAEAFLTTHFGHVEDRRAMLRRIVELDEDGYKDRHALFTELLDELPWQVRPLHSELMAHWKTGYASSSVLADQAREVIERAKSKYRIGLVTNGTTQVQYGKIDHLGIRGDFDLILVSEEAGVKKPDARIFGLAADGLGVRPEECLFIGDHPVNDIEGAARCGMATIWVQANQPWRDGLEAKPLHAIKRLNELLTLL
ncbi:HAD family hydrolase [Paenibacillus sp. R14(2021)]|uniref:HAD family hydrolase n=1 Tax=Paenibacillus sp. R14(2021) TaxID=2859228 RepID=UPI001C613AD9|nr:HAD family hydrolase [Paenibacillus sp. R14(2021)]